MLSGLRRRFRRPQTEMSAALAAEPPVYGPEKAVYSGGTNAYPKVNGNGLIALTRERLLFRILIGTNVDILVADITGVREETAFRRQRVGGKRFLVIETRQGEVGFLVDDLAAWRAQLPQGNPV